MSVLALGNVWTSAGPKRTHLGDKLLFEELVVLRIGIAQVDARVAQVDARVAQVIGE